MALNEGYASCKVKKKRLIVDECTHQVEFCTRVPCMPAAPLLRIVVVWWPNFSTLHINICGNDQTMFCTIANGSFFLQLVFISFNSYFLNFKSENSVAVFNLKKKIVIENDISKSRILCFKKYLFFIAVFTRDAGDAPLDLMLY